MRTLLLLTILLLTQSSQSSMAQQPSAAPAFPEASAPTPDTSGIYNVGNGVSPPMVILAPEPEFTEQARKSKIAGNGTLSLVVDTAGNATEVHVAHSAAESQPPKLKGAALGLDQKAIEAVRLYRFKPATLQGKPVPARITVEVNFQLF